MSRLNSFRDHVESQKKEGNVVYLNSPEDRREAEERDKRLLSFRQNFRVKQMHSKENVRKAMFLKP
jgi:hypothetical protein